MSRYQQLFILILVLVIASIAVIVKYPIKRGLDIAGGVRVVLQAEKDKLPEGQKWSNEHLNSIIRIMRNRVDIQGVSEPIIQPKGNDQIVIELPDIQKKGMTSQEAKDKAIQELQSTARMEFRHLWDVHFSGAKQYRPMAARYTMEVSSDEKGDHYTFTDAEGKTIPESQILADSRLILTGDDLKPVSRTEKDPQTYEAQVALEFTKEGKKKFADFTRRNVNEILAIVLDDKILSAPNINEAILDGRAVISGRFTTQEAQTLAEFINAGALPVPLTAIHKQSVEATLGQASVTKSVTAGIGGLAAVILFMILYYLMPGLIADVALGIYAVLTLAVFKLVGVTMTLPGIAAFILSIGMAVDANILIFERLKEELRTGKTLRAAIDTGFKRAFTSIFDSNMCTLITCAILYNFGTGPIKGFAVVLGLGVIISMFTAITATRTILHLIVNAGFAQNPALYGLGRQWVTGESDRQFNIVGRMKVWFALSAIVILPGLYFWLGAHGLKGGIDFTGGSFTQVEFKQPVTSTGEIDGILARAGLVGSTVQKSKDDARMVFIRTSDLSESQYAEVKDGLTKIGGNPGTSERVGPTISKELTANAVKAVIFSAILIVMYLSVRFAIGGLANGFRFGMCAIIATLHDVVVIIGVFAMFGYFLGWEIDSLFVTALLTVIGFSTHDTIVIFDRIRENLRHRAKGEAFDALVNRSILQSFARSINTSFTVVLTLVALMIFGAHNIQQFIIALLIGVVTGTYSSIFNASQLLVVWQRFIEKPAASKIGEPTLRSPKARDLKPLVEVESSNGGDGDKEIALTDKRAPVGVAKAKAKKRKRRF